MYAKHAKALRGKPSKSTRAVNYISSKASKLYRSAKNKVSKLMPEQGTTKTASKTTRTEAVDESLRKAGIDWEKDKPSKRYSRSKRNK